MTMPPSANAVPRAAGQANMLAQSAASPTRSLCLRTGGGSGSPLAPAPLLPLEVAPSSAATAAIHHRAGSSLLLLLFGFLSLANAFSPPRGPLAGLIEQKRREVERLKRMPEAGPNGAWNLRLSYAASSGQYGLARALGWRPERMVVIADLKRASPGQKLGEVVRLYDNLQVPSAMDAAIELGARAAMVATDKVAYGGSADDLAAATTHAAELEKIMGLRFPVIAKDLIIDPLQIARAACLGADAVLLIAAVAQDSLEDLLDTCTLMGIEAMVEVHTAEELALAAEAGASLLLVNERDRVQGKLISGQACSIASAIPVDATCLACGGISTIEEVRELRAAGYDGVVLGRALAAENARSLGEAISVERWGQRLVEHLKGADIVPEEGPSSIGNSAA